MEAVSDDKRILKHIMIDILNLRNGMEDNLLLMQKVHHIVKNIKSVGLDLLNAITVVQQHIDSINTVYILGVSWLNDKTDFALSYIRGKVSYLKFIDVFVLNFFDDQYFSHFRVQSYLANFEKLFMKEI